MSFRIGLGFDSHAITDALLGAVSAGDIGTFFPPTDPKWKGADSTVFLATALEEIALVGFKIVNIDCVLIMHRPKIVPIAAEMRERVADLLHLDINNVSIKGKTPEGLAQDGTAVAHVVVLLESIKLPDEHKKLALEADAPTEADIDGVVSTLVENAHGTASLGRKLPTFDTDDLT